MRTFGILFLGISATLAAAPPTAAERTEHHTHTAGKPDREQIWRAALARSPLGVSATFDGNGRLWLASVNHGYVVVQHSDDRARTFSTSVRVNREAEHIAADGENRPKIAVAKNGNIYVSYTQNLERPMTGHVRFSRSVDGGRSFAAPITVNDNRAIISHRFEALAVDSRGEVHVVWLDKRDRLAAKGNSRAYKGAALYHAISNDDGRSFLDNTKLADHTCECCRVALSIDPDGVPVVVWRHIFEKNVRDHALLRLDGKARPSRISRDHWEIDACPHHGPAVSIAADGIHHTVWFTNAPERTGLFYARSMDRGASFSAPLGFGDPKSQAARPAVLSLGRRVWIAWKELDGEVTVVKAILSRDRGRTWSVARRLAQTAGASDHPLLISDGRNAYLSWFTRKEGYRLIGAGDNA